MSGVWLKRLVWIILIVVVIGGALYTMRPQPVLVEIGTPTIRTVREFISEEAKTRLAQEYTIDMPVSGTLQRITLEVGDIVNEGDIIARIETLELEQQLAALNARIAQFEAQISGVDVAKPKPEDIASAEVRAREAADAIEIARKEREIIEINLEDARKTLQRVQRSFEEGVGSASQLDEADRAFRALEENLSRARLAEEAAEKGLRVAELNASRVAGSIDDNEYMREVYQAEIDSLLAQRAVVENDLEKATLRAPVTGPVLEKFVDDRRVLAAGTPILTLGDLSTIEIESDILSEEVGRIAPGAAVEIYGKAIPGEAAPGTVKRIYPAGFMKISSLGIEQQRVKVIIAFDNGALNLRVGTRVDVRIITDERQDTLAVPERATFRRDGDWYVFAVENGQAILKPITLGLRNDEWAEITEGLTPETPIILEPKNELEPGSPVAPKE